MFVDPAIFQQPVDCDSAAPQHGRSPDFVAFFVADPAIGRIHTDHLPAAPKLGLTDLVQFVIWLRKYTVYLALGTPVKLAPLAVRLGRCQ